MRLLVKPGVIPRVTAAQSPPSERFTCGVRSAAADSGRRFPRRAAGKNLGAILDLRRKKGKKYLSHDAMHFTGVSPKEYMCSKDVLHIGRGRLPLESR